MNAAIFFTGKFGNTRQYAHWISETTGFPVFDLQKENPDPEQYDVLIMGSSVITGRLTIRKWVRANWLKIKGKSIILFSVSATEPEHADLYRCLEVSLPPGMVRQMDHVALLGKFPPKSSNWWSRLITNLGLGQGKDQTGQEQEIYRLGYSHRISLGPLFERLGQYYIPKTRQEPILEVATSDLVLGSYEYQS